MSFSPPVANPPDSGGAAKWPLLFCFLSIATIVCGYSLWVGPVAFFGDSYLFADRAKHLFFFGNLDLNNHGSLVYPPLYSILIAPCYVLAEAGRIIQAITVLNSLLVASAVFPIFRLVSEYTGATGKERWFLTALIAASPTFLAYAPMVLSESLFIPLAYWTTYAIFRSLKELSVRWFVIAGLLMATALLSRSAATTLFVAGFSAWFVSLFFANRIGWPRTALLLCAAATAFATPLLIWHWIEHSAVTYQGRTDYSIVQALHDLASNRSDQMIKLAWTANALIYFLTAPLSMAAFLVLTILSCRPTLAFRDPLIPFIVTSLALAIASIVVLAPTSYGGGPLTWNKYFAPYVGLLTIVALRLRPLLTVRSAIMALILALGLSVTGRPSELACHFPDALTPFINSALPVPLPALARDLLYFFLIACTMPFLVPSARGRSWHLGAGIAAALCLFANVACARFWRNSGTLNLTNYNGLAIRVLETQKNDPGIPIYYDPDIALGNNWDPLCFLFYYPKPIQQLAAAKLFSLEHKLPKRFYYITRGLLPSAELMATSGENLHLLRIDGSKMGGGFIYQLEYGAGVGGQEAIPFDGESVLVRWLGPRAEFKFHLDAAVPAARIGLRLAASGKARVVTATLNGEVLPEKPVVKHVLWNGGFDYMEWQVRLNTGQNVLVLESDSAPLTLPDGERQVCFLLINEPLLSTPSNTLQ